MPKQVEITPEVRDVLERGHWPSDDLFELPKGQLDRKLYEGVNKVLVALGGKWNRGRQGHVFAGPAREKFEAAMQSGVAVDQKRTMEQFFTPPEIADRVVGMAMPGDGDLILEPSAGGGALIDALIRGGVLPGQIEAIELDRHLYASLRDRFGAQARMIWFGDFMARPIECRFDIIVMNPPFGRGADMAHVTRALEFLRPGGRHPPEVLPPTAATKPVGGRNAQKNAARSFMSPVTRTGSPLCRSALTSATPRRHPATRVEVLRASWPAEGCMLTT